MPSIKLTHSSGEVFHVEYSRAIYKAEFSTNPDRTPSPTYYEPDFPTDVKGQIVNVANFILPIGYTESGSSYTANNGNVIKLWYNDESMNKFNFSLEGADGTIYDRGINFSSAERGLPYRGLYLYEIVDINLNVRRYWTFDTHLTERRWYLDNLNSYDGSFDKNWFNGVEVEHFPGPDSGDGGGDGTFDETSDAIDFPALPQISAIASGMVALFNPNLSTLRELSTYLWRPEFVDLIAKMFQSPMEAIIDLSFINVTPSTSVTNTINVGYVSTGIEAPRVSNQYVELNCGTIKVDEYWGSALDYNPYTSLEIYLPYIGLMRLDTDDCMGAELELRYHIDLLTGTCVAMIKVTKGNLSSVLYSFSGNASSHVPLSATNMSQLVQSVMMTTAQVGIGVATGGASAVAAVSAGAAMNVLGAKMHVEKGGRLDTTGGMLANKTPYLIITRPIQSLAQDYNMFKGYPSNITSVLNTLTGYTEVEYIHLEGLTDATNEEKNMIERLLMEGVII